MSNKNRIRDEKALSCCAEETAQERLDRLLAMGEPIPMMHAAKEAGFARLNLHVLHRAAMSGALLTIKVGGTRYSHPQAVRDWVASTSALPDRAPRAARGRRQAKPSTSAAAKAYLRARGLPTGGGE